MDRAVVKHDDHDPEEKNGKLHDERRRRRELMIMMKIKITCMGGHFSRCGPVLLFLVGCSVLLGVDVVDAPSYIDVDDALDPYCGLVN